MSAPLIVHMLVLAMASDGSQTVLRAPEGYPTMEACEAKIAELKEAAAKAPIIVLSNTGASYVVLGAACRADGNKA